MILKLALRQIKAYKQRTIITVLLTLFATYMFVFISGLTNGTHQIMIDSAVKLYPGFIKVINREFDETPSFDNIIFDQEATRAQIDSAEGVKLSAARFETFALYSTDTQTIGGMFTGIEPEKEGDISKLKESLVEGEYLTSEDTNALYIGSELAKRLKVKVGDKLSFISTGADFSFAADNVYIKGIFKTGLFSFNNAAAFMNKKYFDMIMASENIATSFVVEPTSDKDRDITTTTANIQTKLSNELVAQDYMTFMDDLIDAMEVDSIFGYFQIAIFFVVIFFVIAIYNFLNAYGRIREFGVLKAIGTSPAQIRKLLFAEIFILATIGVGIGGYAGAETVKYLNTNPLNVTDIVGESMDMEEYSKQYDLVMVDKYPAEYDLQDIAWQIAIMYIMTILTIFYPIFMINRYKPVEAIHHV